jgi:hypothetical protein
MRQAHTIQEMSELEAARAILEDVRQALRDMALLEVNGSFVTLLDNIEEAAERIIDLNYDKGIFNL